MKGQQTGTGWPMSYQNLGRLEQDNTTATLGDMTRPKKKNDLASLLLSKKNRKKEKRCEVIWCAVLAKIYSTLAR